MRCSLQAALAVTPGNEARRRSPASGRKPQNELPLELITAAVRLPLGGVCLQEGPAVSRGQAACPFLSDYAFSGDGVAGESVCLVVASGSAATVTSTSAPRFKLTVLPSPFCKTLSILISCYYSSVPSTWICAFSGASGLTGLMFFRPFQARSRRAYQSQTRHWVTCQSRFIPSSRCGRLTREPSPGQSLHTLHRFADHFKTTLPS